MRRTQLLMYYDILQQLSKTPPMKLTHIMYRANVNCSVLKEMIKHLTRIGYIDTAPMSVSRSGSRVGYVITDKGVKIRSKITNIINELEITRDKPLY